MGAPIPDLESPFTTCTGGAIRMCPASLRMLVVPCERLEDPCLQKVAVEFSGHPVTKSQGQIARLLYAHFVPGGYPRVWPRPFSSVRLRSSLERKSTWRIVANPACGLSNSRTVDPFSNSPEPAGKYVGKRSSRPTLPASPSIMTAGGGERLATPIRTVNSFWLHRHARPRWRAPNLCPHELSLRATRSAGPGTCWRCISART